MHHRFVTAARLKLAVLAVVMATLAVAVATTAVAAPAGKATKGSDAPKRVGSGAPGGASESSLITPTRTATSLSTAMTGSANVTGASFPTITPNGNPAAVSDTGLTGFPTNGSNYAVLSSGDAGFADDPNTDEGSGVSNGGAAVRGDTDRDVTILKVDLSVPAGANCLTFDVRFLSEEYPEYVGGQYNDALIAELDSSTWTTSGSAITAPNNFATDPSGDVLSVNAQGFAGFSEGDGAPTTYDGGTSVITPATPITAGNHSLYLSIFDQGDSILDSAALLDNLRVANVPAGSCASRASSIATVQGGRLRFYAAADTTNNVTVTKPSGTTFRITDPGAPIRPLPGCTAVNANTVDCSATGVTGLDVSAGDKNDIVTNSAGMASNLLGGDGDDTLNGGSAADTLKGGKGADTMFGGGATDTVSYAGTDQGVEASIDSVANDGDADDDNGTNRDNIRGDVENITGSGGPDTLTGNSGANVLTGGGDDDTLDGSTGPDTLFGSSGVDGVTYSGRGAVVTADIDAVADDGDSSDGPAGARDNVRGDVENLTGGNLGDTLTGNSSDNELTGGPGTDTLNGGVGFDTLSGEGEADALNGGDDNDDLSGGDGGDNLKGGSGGDFVRGDAGGDTLNGDADNDRLIGGPDADTMFGGSGRDLANYEDASDPVSVSIDAAANDGNADDGPAGARDNVRGDVEDLTGGNGNDTLTGGSNNNGLDGGPGADTMFGSSGIDEVSYQNRFETVDVSIDAVANDGNADDGPAGARDNVRGDVERMVGGDGDDTLRGGANNNTLIGGPGADVMFGGSGVDTVSYETTFEPVTASIDAVANDGGDADDNGTVKDNIRGDVENLIGTFNDDTLRGGGNPNTLDGAGGADTMFGGGGTDTVTYADRVNAVTVDIDAVADDGNDDDDNGVNKDNVRGDVENLIGSSAGDTLTGSGGNNALTGGGGADSLFGLGGIDTFAARDGVTDTRIACGAQADTVTADTADPADADCETVNRP